MTGFGKRVKELRKEHDLTIDMLVADLKNKYPNLSIHKSMISRWEREDNEPSLTSAKALCEYFNVSLDYMIGLTDVRTPSRLLASRKERNQ